MDALFLASRRPRRLASFIPAGCAATNFWRITEGDEGF